MPNWSTWEPKAPGKAAHAFFISHVSEDGAAVAELNRHLTTLSGQGGRRPFKCFLDVNDWPLGSDIRATIRASLFDSEFMVAWITPAILKTDRAWVWFELAYAEWMEERYEATSESPHLPFVVPIFLGVELRQIGRTPLLDYWQRSLLSPPGRQAEVAEIAETLLKFYEHQNRQRRQSRTGRAPRGRSR